MGGLLFLFALLAASTIPGLALPRSACHNRTKPSGSNGTPGWPSKSFSLPFPANPSSTLSSPPPVPTLPFLANPSSSVSLPDLSTTPVLLENTPIPAATPSPSQPASNTTSSSSDIQAFLDGHNTLRGQHGANPVTWNSDLAAKAEEWAEKCNFVHSLGALGPYGENLAAGTGSEYDIAAALKSWSDEASSYDPNNPESAGHFTQMVWKSTTEIGCALYVCNNSNIFDLTKYGPTKFVVCEYNPAGNVVGHYSENVQP